jgi:GH35 family endo-1,4-beta-xylanase
MVGGLMSAVPMNQVSAIETPVENTFDVNYDGWYNVGDLTTVTALAGGYNSARAMFVDNRQSVDDGAEAQKGYYIEGGHKYNYSVYVKADTDETFILTLRYLYPDETYGYKNLVVKDVKAGEWTKLEAVYTAPEGTVNLSPIITTDSTNDFWFDQFVVTETTKKAFVVEASGGDGLEDIYANYFRVGCAVSPGGNNGLSNSMIQGIILKHFNSITPENELKPNSTLRNIANNGSTDTNIIVNLNDAATIMEFCATNGIGMRGHTLVWHSQTPDNFFKQNFNANGANVSTSVMNTRLQSYANNMFRDISTKYPSLDLYAFDVVNEAMTDNGATSNWRTSNRQGGFSNGTSAVSAWVAIYGNNSFIENAFSAAAAARDTYYPGKMKLFYNDYNEYISGKRDAITAMAKELFGKGLDGVGMQAHLSDTYPNFQTFSAALDGFLAVGCEVQITELDITGSNTTTMYKQIFQKAVEVSQSTNRFTALVVWGTTNASSWRAGEGNQVLLFDNSGNGNANFQQVSGESVVPKAQWGDGNSPKGAEPYVPPTPNEPDQYGRFFFDTFESGVGNWAGRDGNGEVTAVRATPSKAYDGTGALAVSGRTSTWMGTARQLSTLDFQPGKSYQFGGAVMSTTADTNWQLSVYYTSGGEDNYVTIDTGSSAAGEWCNLEGTIELPADAASMMVYFETEYFEEDGAGNLTDFYVDNAYGGNVGCVSPLKQQAVETTTTTQATTTTTSTRATTTSTRATTTTTVTIAPPTVAYGDIDGDGSVGKMADIVLLGKYLKGSIALNNSALTASDCDASGNSKNKIDTADLSALIGYLLSTVGSLPVV